MNIKKMDTKTALIIVAVSGWVTAAVLFVALQNNQKIMKRYEAAVENSLALVQSMQKTVK
jgi:hypothetical protein